MKKRMIIYFAFLLSIIVFMNFIFAIEVQLNDSDIVGIITGQPTFFPPSVLMQTMKAGNNIHLENITFELSSNMNNASIFVIIEEIYDNGSLPYPPGSLSYPPIPTLYNLSIDIGKKNYTINFTDNINFGFGKRFALGIVVYAFELANISIYGSLDNNSYSEGEIYSDYFTKRSGDIYFNLQTSLFNSTLQKSQMIHSFSDYVYTGDDGSAQQFILNNNVKLDKVSLYLGSNGDISGDNVRLRVYEWNDSSTFYKPIGNLKSTFPVLTGNTIGSDLTGKWYNFSSSSVILHHGINYDLEVELLGSGSNPLMIFGTNSAPEEKFYCEYQSSPIFWDCTSTHSSMAFQIWGESIADYCGDGYCDSPETLSSCPSDCGSVSPPSNFSSGAYVMNLSDKIVDLNDLNKGMLPDVFNGLYVFFGDMFIPFFIIVISIFIALIIFALGMAIFKVFKKIGDMQ